MKKYFAATALVLIAAVGAPPAAAAPRVGDGVTCTSNLFDCSSDSATVGSGVEFTLTAFPSLSFNADFMNDALQFTNTSGVNVDLTNVRFVFTDTTSPFTQATLTSSSGVTNVSQSNVTLNNGRLSLYFNTGTTSFAPGGILNLQLGPQAAAAVPEPATWGMLVLGFGVIGFAMRRNRKVAISYAV